MPYVLLPTGGAKSGLDSPTEMLDDYADDRDEDRLAEARLAEARLAETRLAEARLALAEARLAEDRLAEARLALAEARLAEDRLAEARLAEARQVERQTERQTQQKRMWILFHGDTEPSPLDDLTLAQEMRLEQGWPYTYVKMPDVKTAKSPQANN